MAKKNLSAKELQELKCKAEVRIADILFSLNQKCADNHFQYSGIEVKAHDTDHDMTFEVDINIQ